jgi:fatty acid desaturase
VQASLPEVDAIDRAQLADSRGRVLKQFRRGLAPRWSRVWIDIGGGYLAIGLVMVALARLEERLPRLLPLWALLGAIVFGYLIAYVQLFFHEAAHFNIAPGKKLNDALGTVFLGLMVGTEVRTYRKVHFDHHRYLGTPRDSERSYFEPLNARFILEGLLGIKMLRIMSHRKSRVVVATGPQAAPAEDAVPGISGPRRLAVLAAGAAANLAVVAAAAAAGHWAVAIAWTVGMVSVHPLINALRQLVEHRRFDARADVDYTVTDHGAVTRMFGAGPISSTFGGAGFNRHLLHHWDPQLSYTRFAEMEAFLLDTPSAPVFRAQTTTYLRAFRRLFNAVG